MHHKCISWFFLLMITAQIGRPQSVRSLRVKPSTHYFVDQSGKPFFWLGDTEWELFHQLSVSDAKEILRIRKEQGFTAVQVMTTGVFPEWAIMKKISRDTSNEAWLNGDPAKMNENYFRGMDSIIAYAAAIDLQLIVGVYHAQDVDNHRITKENARPWARWLAHRYRNASHVIWSMYPHADPASFEILNEIVKGIHEGDNGNHLITIHPDPSPKSSSFFEPASWLSFNTLQTWNSGLINYSLVLEDYYKIPIKPVVNGEARYEEEDGTTSMDTRRAGYFSMLAGGFYSFGHQDNWRAAATWKSWIRSAGASQMKIMADIFKMVDWWNVIPDSTIIIKADHGNIAARSNNGTWLITYLSVIKPITISSKFLSLIKQARIQWIDPSTGKKINAVFTIDNEGINLIPPAWKDAVLIIHKPK